MISNVLSDAKEPASGTKHTSAGKLLWRQSQMAWLAQLPDGERARNSRITHPIPSAVRLLCSHLLQIGGKKVCVHFCEPPAVCQIIAANGEIMMPDTARMVPGRRNDCHCNVALLCSLMPNLVHVTGYALSGDGMWRRHSWAVTPDQQVVETTCSMAMYFGVVT